ncbi:MAG: thermonuclease family protein, partial [Alphaproteobacteria bacterium]|nr:thermonuclease family protein [Alphaproteobacteria bacterium]
RRIPRWPPGSYTTARDTIFALVVGLAILRKAASGKRSRQYQAKGYSGRTGGAQQRKASWKSSVKPHRPAHRVESPAREITGKAYVTDGDGIRVARQEVRLAGLDAPEYDQKAKHRAGYWFNHGKRVKSALIQEIAGKHVHVSVESADKFGRLVGTVTYRDKDIGEWLVREGHAIAAYDDRYRQLEREARRAKRGMWAHAHNFDPRAHRHRETRKG